MTTTVPKIYSFSEFAGVADAVANHVINAQNQALVNSLPSNNSTTSVQNLQTLTSHSIPRNDPSIESNSTNNESSKNPTPSVSSSNLASASATPPLSSSALDKKSKKAKEKIINKRFKIAISGGSLISVLAQGLLKREDVIWDKWDIYFADERLVPFSDEHSNYGLAKRELFDKLQELGKPQPKVYHIDESLLDDAQEVADAYEKILIKGFASKDSVRLPLFDLFLLGCAPDGHIASIFPNDHEVLREKFAWVVPVENAPSGPTRRITLTIPVICHSHRVSFVVEGAVKASIVKTILERPEKGLPASIVNEGSAGRIAWFVDKDALAETYFG
ncbi:putative 6-phosphogluconolactonase 1 [Wickerhamomyces ciferrii]|uniref:6-phosphogluconolactonase 1 n=1 Tax=Wickerhamomyces ciferrii (strain ATCC 14091 / BCRC 22168 / CBS 111 / JCM 3599 / NBRC 0793 / NRRL Y-1031 F-60-10) TaxID=1206466 RepID=K0L0S8_WICCF|nr:putative 6-phosphogluconolactonase 1 [Wickerhamomyces ciferrii]CCH47058.1 putative 6-phosphogluconolactonase 1 [Wickerhamomyces ciferrii]